MVGIQAVLGSPQRFNTLKRATFLDMKIWSVFKRPMGAGNAAVSTYTVHTFISALQRSAAGPFLDCERELRIWREFGHVSMHIAGSDYTRTWY